MAFYRCRPNLHRGLTLGQQGWFGVALVSFPQPVPQNRTQGHTGASSFFLPRTGLPLPLKGRGGVSSNLARWDFPAEKPGAFPQEKTDTLYPRASLGSCQGNCWPQLAHTAPTGPFWGFPGVVPYPAPKTAHKAAQGRVWVSPSFPGVLLFRQCC